MLASSAPRLGLCGVGRRLVVVHALDTPIRGRRRAHRNQTTCSFDLGRWEQVSGMVGVVSGPGGAGFRSQNTEVVGGGCGGWWHLTHQERSAHGQTMFGKNCVSHGLNLSRCACAPYLMATVGGPDSAGFMNCPFVSDRLPAIYFALSGNNY